MEKKATSASRLTTGGTSSSGSGAIGAASTSRVVAPAGSTPADGVVPQAVSTSSADVERRLTPAS